MDKRSMFSQWLKNREMSEVKFLDKVKDGVLAQYCASKEELRDFMPGEANLRYVVLPVYTPVANKLRELGWDAQKVSDVIMRGLERK